MGRKLGRSMNWFFCVFSFTFKRQIDQIISNQIVRNFDLDNKYKTSIKHLFNL